MLGFTAKKKSVQPFKKKKQMFVTRTIDFVYFITVEIINFTIFAGGFSL